MRRNDNHRLETYLRHRRKRGCQSLSAFFAFCEIRRAARAWVRLPSTTPLVIALIVPPGGDLDAHATAARLVFDPAVARSDGNGSCVAACDGLSTGSSVEGADSEWLLANGARLVAVARQVDDLPGLLRFTADEVIHLEAPRAAHLLAAAQLVLGSSMTLEEAGRLEDERVDVLAATLRAGRAASRSIVLADRIQAARQIMPAGPSLGDLHGLGEAGEWGRELVKDLADWRAGFVGWGDVDRGVLLSGPPGTGKTMFAAALARSARVGLVVASVARWQATGKLDDLLGAMRQAFDEARRRAPVILFIDEVDAVGDRERFSGDNAQYHSQVVAALLECLDGAEGREGVVVVGATNRPQALDAALLRPGRLDRQLTMPLPDEAARKGILRFHLGERCEGIDLTHAASRTRGWSGAMLERLARDTRRLARREQRALTAADFDACLPESIRLSDADLRRTAVHEAGHAVIAERLRPGSVLKASVPAAFDQASAEPHRAGAMVQNGLGPGHRTIHDILDGVAILLAGGAAEELVFGERSTASGGWPTSDLHEATLELLRIELSFGLGGGMAFVSPSGEDRALLECLTFDVSLKKRVERGLRQQRDRVGALLARERSALQAIADALWARGQLEAAELQGLLRRASCSEAGDQEPRQEVCR